MIHPLEAGTGSVASRIASGLTKISLALKNQAWRHAGPRRLTPTQGQILVFLRSSPDQSASLSAIAQYLAATLPTACDAVRSLVKKGLLHKCRTDADGRMVSIGLTARGRLEADHAIGWPDFLTEAINTLSGQEQKVFFQAVLRVIQTLQERGQISISRMCLTCRHFRPYVHADPEQPHHCALVDAPFGDRLIRIDCPEHEPAAEPAHPSPSRMSARN